MRRSFAYVSLALSVCAFFFAFAPQLHADAIDDFTYQEGTLTLQWQLPASPTPVGFSLGQNFFVQGIPFTLDGIPATSDQIFFESASNTNSNRGGFTFNFQGEGLIVATGPQVYSGPESAPTFIPNTYAVIDTPLGGPSTAGRLTIAPVAAVPEPSTLLLFSMGILALGCGVSVMKLSASLQTRRTFCSDDTYSQVPTTN